VPAVAALLLLAWAMRTPAGPDDSLVLAPSTTSQHSTTSPTSNTSTTASEEPTTTPTTNPNSPEAIAAEIEAFLAGLSPPEFKPKEVRDIREELDHVMREWEEGDREKVVEELEKAVEKVDKLAESVERDELLGMFERLADSVGVELEDRGDDDD
jgi:truncated hemoglobin YjbI